MTIVSTAGKRTLRMCRRRTSAPSRGRAARARREGSVDAVRRTPEGGGARRSASGLPAWSSAASSRLASRPWPQPMSSTRERGAIRPWASRGGTPGPSAACRAQSAGQTAAGGRRRWRVDQLAHTPPPPGNAHGSASGGAARRAHGDAAARRPPRFARCGQGFGQGHRSQSGRGAAPEQRRQDAQHHRLVGRGARAVAVVDQQDVARRKAVAEPGQHAFGIAPHRVVTAPRPAHQFQAEPVEHRREERIAQPGGRPEVARLDAGDVGQAGLRRADLARHRARPEQGKGVRVAVAVVLHAVAAAHDLAAKGRVAGGGRSDREEGRPRRMRVEQVEHLRRDFGIGAVVDRDRDLGLAARQREGSTVAGEPGRARPEPARSAPDDWATAPSAGPGRANQRRDAGGGGHGGMALNRRGAARGDFPSRRRARTTRTLAAKPGEQRASAPPPRDDCSTGSERQRAGRKRSRRQVARGARRAVSSTRWRGAGGEEQRVVRADRDCSSKRPGKDAERGALGAVGEDDTVAATIGSQHRRRAAAAEREGEQRHTATAPSRRHSADARRGVER